MAVEHQILGQEKTCTKCGLPKVLSDFHKEARNTGPIGAGRYSWCKTCVQSHKSTPERLNRTKYKIDFNAFWEKQKGLCAVCGEPMLPKGKELTSVAVDHDHNCCPANKSCGRCVRGLIHQRCNMVVGYSGDNPQLLEQAAVYLRQWREGLT